MLVAVLPSVAQVCANLSAPAQYVIMPFMLFAGVCLLMTLLVSCWRVSQKAAVCFAGDGGVCCSIAQCVPAVTGAARPPSFGTCGSVKHGTWSLGQASQQVYAGEFAQA